MNLFRKQCNKFCTNNLFLIRFKISSYKKLRFFSGFHQQSGYVFFLSRFLKPIGSVAGKASEEGEK